MKYDIVQIVSNVMGANCYLINYNNKTIIIDPCVNCDVLEKYNVKEVEAILITHGHIDHIAYLKEIVYKYNPTVYATKKGLEMIYNDDLNLSNYFIKPLEIKNDSFRYIIIEDNKTIIEDLNIKCITTPGHTKCSVCYLLENNLFTGDTLFDRSVGRTDFPTGNSLELRESLKKILRFNKDFIIYPGHNNISTIEEQKKKNYYLQF